MVPKIGRRCDQKSKKAKLTEEIVHRIHPNAASRKSQSMPLLAGGPSIDNGRSFSCFFSVLFFPVFSISFQQTPLDGSTKRRGRPPCTGHAVQAPAARWLQLALRGRQAERKRAGRWPRKKAKQMVAEGGAGYVHGTGVAAQGQ